MKTVVYVISIILIFDILFVLLLIRNSKIREKESEEISKNIIKQMSQILEVDKVKINILDEYEFLKEFLNAGIEDKDIPNYNANYYIKAGENIYGVMYDYKEKKIIHIQLQDEYIYNRK
jgi:hypothetical protein